MARTDSALTEFPYSDEFRSTILRQLADREGRPEHDEWFRMALTRVDFQRRHFLPALLRYTDCEGKSVLEIGCGTGPSSVVMAERGARILALDVNPEMVEAARLRVRDHGYSGSVDVRLVAQTRSIESPDASFDLVVCNGVLEHVRPADRRPMVREMWRVLKPHGHLFIGETPNRLWPIDDHTTGLFGTHYLPAKVARRYAVLRRRVKPSDDFLAMGSMGCRFGEITRSLPRDRARVLNWYAPASWLARHKTTARGFARVIVTILAAVQAIVLKPLLGLPIDGLLPYLTIGIEKLG